MKQPALRETNFPELKLLFRGKVRDIYDLGEYLLLVITDRMSAFDVIMNELIPGKGYVLTQLSLFWFKMFEGYVRTHLITANPEEYPRACRPYKEILQGRSMLVRKCKPLPVECIVRGYLSGSGWAEYQKTGTIAGLQLPPGLVESQALPKPEFTPSTKAELGQHDENISFERMASTIGEELASHVKALSLGLYTKGCAWAEPRGIIIADTKFEFGIAPNGELLLIDEVLTADSSRFWPKDQYKPGGPQPSYDKQPLRDYLASLKPRWNKQPPPPKLPEWVVTNTTTRYREALYHLTGQRAH